MLGESLEQQEIDPKINPETGEEWSTYEKLSHTLAPAWPSIQNIVEQTVQSGIVAADNLFTNTLPKGGVISNWIEKTAKKSGLMIDSENVDEFDASTLIDQLLYFTGDYDLEEGEYYGTPKFKMTERRNRRCW